jgi:hypothetical protein
MSYVTVQISGELNVWKLQEIRELVGSKHLYRKGTDHDIYLDLLRSDAHLLIANLNNTPGVRAKIVNE